MSMDINIKNERVERLLAATPASRVHRVLEGEVWPSISAQALGRRLTKAEEETILGSGVSGA